MSASSRNSVGRKNYRTTVGNKLNGLNTEYISGSAVRKTAAAPVLEPERREREKREYTNAEKAQIRQKKSQILLAHRANMIYTMAVTAVVVVIFGVCSQYLSLQSNVKANAAIVTQLQSKLNQMTVENDEFEMNLNANIDYDAIYNTAIKDLGMVYPSKDQIVTYDAQESEYVKQFADIPEAQ